MTGYFIYGDVDTRNYEGIVVSEDEVDSAPERAYEEITIAGRNGTLLLDGNRYENVIHSYDITVYDDYVDNLIKLRNDILSKVGYQVLRDSFNPDEKYLARVYTQVIPKQKTQRDAGNMHIEFSRKPQRFLVDGDRAISPTEWHDIQTESGELVTIDSDGSLAVKALEVSLSPIQAGSGTPSPTNIRPISGRTEVVTQRTGKNLLNLDRTLGTPNPSAGTNTTSPRVMDTEHYYVGLRCDNYYYPSNIAEYSVANNEVTVRGANNAYGVGFPIEVKPNTQYKVSATVVGSGYLGITYYDAQWHYISFNNDTSAFTTPSNASYAVILLRSLSTSATATWKNVQVELGTTATSYEPYNGTTYTTSLGRTVYGGTLDVVSGVLTVDKAMATLVGGNWSKSSSYPGGFYISNGTFPTAFGAPKPKDKTPLICSHASTAKTLGEYVNGTCYSDQSTNIRIMSADTTVSEWLQYLADQNDAGTPVQVCYELATPQTYQLTPQQIDLLLGTNHLWSDGEITLTYGVHPYYNPTPFASKPLIKVTGTGTLGIGEYILTITGTASQTLYIDCETMEIYTIEGTVPTGASSLVSINKNDFPVLEPGTNNISVGSGITDVTITPRWWRI